MTKYFKTSEEALSDAIMVIMEAKNNLIWGFSKAQCDCGESKSIVIDDLISNKQVCNNIICETCHNEYE